MRQSRLSEAPKIDHLQQLCVSADIKTERSDLLHVQPWNIDFTSCAWHKQSQFDLKTYVTVAEIKFYNQQSMPPLRRYTRKCTPEDLGIVVRLTAIITPNTTFPSKTHRTIRLISSTFTTRPAMDLTRLPVAIQLRSTILQHHPRRSIIQENRAYPIWRVKEKATKLIVITTRPRLFLRNLPFSRQSLRYSETRKLNMAYTKETRARN